MGVENPHANTCVEYAGSSGGGSTARRSFFAARLRPRLPHGTQGCGHGGERGGVGMSRSIAVLVAAVVAMVGVTSLDALMIMLAAAGRIAL